MRALFSSREQSKLFSLVSEALCDLCLFLFPAPTNLMETSTLLAAPRSRLTFSHHSGLWQLCPVLNSLHRVIIPPPSSGELFALSSYTEPCILQQNLSSWPHDLISGWVCDRSRPPYNLLWDSPAVGSRKGCLVLL